MCGTSTGGLLAILFGRLRMRCDEAWETYLRLGRSIFEKNGNDFRVKGPDLESLIRNMMEEVIQEKLGDAGATMHPSPEEEDVRCRVSA